MDRFFYFICFTPSSLRQFLWAGTRLPARNLKFQLTTVHFVVPGFGFYDGAFAHPLDTDLFLFSLINYLLLRGMLKLNMSHYGVLGKSFIILLVNISDPMLVSFVDREGIAIW